MLTNGGGATGALYVGDLTFAEFLNHTTAHHPALAGMIEPHSMDDIGPYLDRMRAASWEFETDSTGGRGTVYNVAQKARANRAVDRKAPVAVGTR